MRTRITKKAAGILTLLLLSLALAACGVNDDATVPASQFQDLQAQYNRLEAEYDQVLAQFNRINSDFKSGEFLEPLVEKQPVLYHVGDKTLQVIQERGRLTCGVNANVPGFGLLSPGRGGFNGFDIDFCRAVGAATLGERGATKVDFLPQTGRSRFVALQSGEVDVLIRNTTLTLTRDTELGLDFTTTIFYDGQGMLVNNSSGIRRLDEMETRSICVTEGTTSADNAQVFFDNKNIEVRILPYTDSELMREDYQSGVCDGFTADKSALIGQQLLLEDPAAHRILPEDISREPLGPVVRHGDDNWRDVVEWTVQCTLNAEYLGVNKDNVEDLRASEDIQIKRLLGTEPGLGKKLGLADDFCYQVIRQVGNYADIYDSNVGIATDLNLPRSLNALFRDGGVLYPMPFK